MYNIQSERNYVILSSIVQLVNYMFRPLNTAVTAADYDTTQLPPHSIECKQDDISNRLEDST